MTKVYTGGSVSYYRVHVANPTKIEKPYDAECNDIIEALNMNYAEGNAFKAIWRKCAAELGQAKQGYLDGLYDSEKVEFFGARMVAQAKKAKAPTEQPSHIISDITIDLSEWQEWKKGDIVESMESGGGITNGDSYILIADPEQESGDIRFYDDEGCARIRDADKYRFVLRPTSTAK